MLRKVLIVEDSTLQAKMYRTVFCAYPGCEMVFALNGIEALDRLATEQEIDLVILDINMPKMDGLSFLDAKRSSANPEVPVIVISTEGKDEDIMRALQAGARAFVKKPWKPSAVQEVVNRIIKGA